MSLLFNTLSSLVITFLPRSKCLLISWLQSLSAVILEPKKIKSKNIKPGVQQVTEGNSSMSQDTAQNVKYHLLIHVKHQQSPKCLIERTSLEKGDQTFHAKETKGRLRCYDREGNNLKL